MSKLLREPLFYFLILGAVMFGIYDLVADKPLSGNEQSQEIIISDGQIDVLILGFEKTWQRLPNQQELDGLVEEFIREEIFYREAVAMGLDKNDTIIRRRLKQKIEFLSEDIASLEQPETQELQAFLDDNLERYLTSSRFTFQQVYINASDRGPSALDDAQVLLAKLQNDANIDISELGDRLMMTQPTYTQINDNDVKRTLGNQFLTALKTLPLGSWQGPVESGFGLHLVLLTERIEPSAPPLDDVRNEVLRDWTSVKREEVNKTFYTALRQRYTVTIEDNQEVTQ